MRTYAKRYRTKDQAIPKEYSLTRALVRPCTSSCLVLDCTTFAKSIYCFTKKTTSISLNISDIDRFAKFGKERTKLRKSWHATGIFSAIVSQATQAEGRRRGISGSDGTLDLILKSSDKKGLRMCCSIWVSNTIERTRQEVVAIRQICANFPSIFEREEVIVSALDTRQSSLVQDLRAKLSLNVHCPSFAWVRFSCRPLYLP